MNIETTEVEFFDGPLDGTTKQVEVFQILVQHGYLFGWCGVINGEQFLYVEAHPRTPGPPTKEVRLPKRLELWHNDGWATCLL